MKLKHFFAVVLAVAVLLMLTGCGAGEMLNASNKGVDAEGGYTYAAEEGVQLSESGEGLTSTNQSGESTAPTGQKLIRTVTLDAETEDMDALLADVQSTIAQLGGYVESRNVYNGGAASQKSRWANLTIRIPAQQLDQFVTQVSGVSNVTNHSETTKDVTLSYVATESRIKALETEEARLLELLAAAQDLKDLLTLEEKLTDVRTELEQHKSQLRLYDNQVDYATVHLSVQEVVEYTVVEEPEPEPTFWERLWNGFTGGFKNVWLILKGLAIFIVSAIPYLILPGVVVFLVFLPRILRRSRAKKAQKTQQKTEEQ